jgi:hypothetical protein
MYQRAVFHSYVQLPEGIVNRCSFSKFNRFHKIQSGEIGAESTSITRILIQPNYDCEQRPRGMSCRSFELFSLVFFHSIHWDSMDFGVLGELRNQGWWKSPPNREIWGAKEPSPQKLIKDPPWGRAALQSADRCRTRGSCTGRPVEDPFSRCPSRGCTVAPLHCCELRRSCDCW